MMKKKFLIGMLACLFILSGCSDGGITLTMENSKQIIRQSSYSAAFEQGMLLQYESAESGYEIFVSPNGNDSNDGLSLPNALKTIREAQKRIQDYVFEDGTGNCTIWLDDGEYYVADTIAFTSNDLPEGKLYIRAIHANQATVSGAKRIDNSSVKETTYQNRGRVWEIPCTEEVNQLYVNNSYTTRARYPDSGFYAKILNWDPILKRIIVDKRDVEKFDNLIGTTMVIQTMWAEAYPRIKNVEINGDVAYIYLEDGAQSIYTIENPAKYARQSFHFENSLEFLDQQGEWYCDPQVGKLYYKPFDGETLENTTLRIPSTDELFTFIGDISNPINGVVIEGINIKYTANTHVDGKLGNQGNVHDEGLDRSMSGEDISKRPISAIFFNYAQDITLRGNIFGVTGGGAVDFLVGNKNINIEGNRFYAVGGSALLIGSMGYDITQVSLDEKTFNEAFVISNNFFTDIGWQEYAGTALTATYIKDSEISHNVITNVRCTGISVGWGWSYDAYPFLRNNAIKNNYIRNAENLLADGAAIYCVGAQPNTVVEGNYIHDMYNSVWRFPRDVNGWWSTGGIYLDQGVGGILDPDTGLVSEPVVVKNNFVDENSVEDDRYKQNLIMENGVVLTIPEEGAGAEILSNAGLEEPFSSVAPAMVYITGQNTVDSSNITVFGKNFGSKIGAIIAKDPDGNLRQIPREQITAWQNDRIDLQTQGIGCGELIVVTASGEVSNRFIVTTGVNEDDVMYNNFDAWGGLIGLDNLKPQKKSLTNITASSIYDSSCLPEFINDTYTGRGWSSKYGLDEISWVSFDLKEASTIEYVVMYMRPEIDQPECRSNFIIEASIETQPGKEEWVTIYEQGNAPLPHESILAAPVPEEYKNTVFKHFRISHKIKGTAFYVAEVAVL